MAIVIVMSVDRNGLRVRNRIVVVVVGHGEERGKWKERGKGS